MIARRCQSGARRTCSTNASDALGERAGARSIVQARRVRELDPRWDAAPGATVGPGQWVLVEVADTGVGMDEQTRGRVFEPFFTTKETGHGLGLAACLGIISAHGGAVLVVRAWLGARRLLLDPVALERACRARRRPMARPAADAARRPAAGVLIVDDEALVRAQLRRSLELRGYTVAEATNGAEAIAALDPAQDRGRRGSASTVGRRPSTCAADARHRRAPRS